MDKVTFLGEIKHDIQRIEASTAEILKLLKIHNASIRETIEKLNEEIDKDE